MHQIFPRCDLQEQPTSPRIDGTPRHWPAALADGGPAALIIDSAGKLLYANPIYRALARSIDSNLSGEIGEAAIIPHGSCCAYWTEKGLSKTHNSIGTRKALPPRGAATGACRTARTATTAMFTKWRVSYSMRAVKLCRFASAERHARESTTSPASPLTGCGKSTISFASPLYRRVSPMFWTFRHRRC